MQHRYRTNGAIAEHAYQNKARWASRIKALRQQAASGAGLHRRRISEPEPASSSSKRLRQDNDNRPSNRPRQSLPSHASSSQHVHRYGNAIASGSGTSTHNRRQVVDQYSSSPDPVDFNRQSGPSRLPISRDSLPRPAAFVAPRVATFPPRQLEPPAFKNLGVAESGHPSHLPFCFFCGDGKDAPFTELGLAAASPAPEMRGAMVGVPARTGCAACTRFYELEKNFAEADEDLVTILDRLGVVTKTLVEEGLKERLARVPREQGE